MSPLVWDLGAHRRLRGPLARAPPRRRAAAARRPRRRSTTRSRRRARCAATSRSCAATRRSTTSTRCASARSTVLERDGAATSCPRAGPAARAPAHRDDAPGARSSAGLPGGAPPARDAAAGAGLELGRRSPRGAFAIGAPRRRLRLRQRAPAPRGRASPRFRIARTPVTNATWLHFVEGGGYERREWWSRRGLGVEGGVRHHPPRGWAAGRAQWRVDGEPLTPVQCTSPGSRPTPSRAAPGPGSRPRRSGRGRRPGTTGCRARQDVGRRLGVDRRREFDGYPGFARPPVPRVLRGLLRRRLPRAARRLVGDARRACATPTFRNWDLPQRRQIFAGVRLARGRLTTASVDSPPVGPATSARSPTTCSTA